MNARQRANIDRDNHDLGTARGRLMALASQSPHDPALCEEIAEICWSMKDPVEAGRWFFQCNSSRAEAENCIEMFVRRHGRVEAQVVSALPIKMAQSIRKGAAPDYITKRLASLAKPAAPMPPSNHRRPGLFWKGMGTFGCLVAAMVVVVLLALGVAYVVDFVRDFR